MSTKIEWAEETWSPVTGCSPISSGCQNCYARRMATWLRGRFGYPKDNPFSVTYHPDRMNQPSKWKKPRRIFVCSMGDLFHEDVERIILNQIYLVMMNNPQHTFLILTKRPHRMLEYIPTRKYISNLCLGVSISTNDDLWMVDKLLEIEAATRFISVEPMLSEIDISDYLDPILGIHWVICGAETGAGKRPMKTEWALFLRDQCKDMRVPFFFKKDSAGNHELDNKLYEEYPNFGGN